MDKKKLAIGLLISSMTLVGSGCAQKVKEEVDRKVAAETTINTQADLNAETERVLETAKGLTEEQRAKLIALRERTRQETQALNTESLRLRAVLVKELLAPEYNRTEVSVLKSKIKKADQKKTDVLMSAIKESNLILGQQARENEERFDRDYIMRDYNF